MLLAVWPLFLNSCQYAVTILAKYSEVAECLVGWYVCGGKLQHNQFRLTFFVVGIFNDRLIFWASFQCLVCAMRHTKHLALVLTHNCDHYSACSPLMHPFYTTYAVQEHREVCVTPSRPQVERCSSVTAHGAFCFVFPTTRNATIMIVSNVTAIFLCPWPTSTPPKVLEGQGKLLCFSCIMKTLGFHSS